MLKKLKKLSIHTHFVIRTVITAIGVIIVLIDRATYHTDTSMGMLIGLALIIIGIVWHMVFVRCPQCGSHFSPKRGLPKYCPWCGKYIDKFH